MGSPLYKVAAGTIDGANRQFSAPFDIDPGGILSAALNGTLIPGAVHDGGALFSVPVGSEPIPGDEVEIWALVEGEAVTTPVLEILTPAPNGVNLVFNTSQDYQAASLVVQLNGQWGGAEHFNTDPGGGVITLTSERVPSSLDDLRVYYLPGSSPPAPAAGGLLVEVDVLLPLAVGVDIEDPDDIAVDVTEAQAVEATAEIPEDIAVDVEIPLALTVEIEDP